MIFHWLRVYGKAGQGATAVAGQMVDDVFVRSVSASPEVFEQSSTQDAARKAKFEHMCPWLARALAGTSSSTRRAVMEAMVDRIEVSLREAGVSDMKVGPEVRKYVAALNGRMQRYLPLVEKADWGGLAAALAEHGVDAALAGAVQAQSGKNAA